MHVELLESLVPGHLLSMTRALLDAPPRSLLEPGALEGADETQVLSLATVAATAPALSEVLHAALGWLDVRRDTLSAEDRGRYWHLVGVASLSRDVLRATVAMNRALSLVTPAYQPRVHDSLGRLLQAQGLVEEARLEYRTALAAREALGDEDGAALTLGNLARLELDNGNWLAARDAFQRDHDIVLRRTPQELRVRSQLLSHLGECERGLGNHKEASGWFERARATAAEAKANFGEAVATVEQVRELISLRSLATVTATLDAVAIGLPQIAPVQRDALLSLLEVARAEHAAKEERVLDAESHFARAMDAAQKSGQVSPIRQALMAREAARFQREAFGGGRDVEYLQRALVLLDGTSAAALRAEVESELRRASNDAWTLHVVGRFLGRNAIELALREAGQAGFRGERVEVAVLFADLRGFTSAAEGLSPVELVGGLNHILSRMAACVENAGGVVDKFVGDAVMALFGVGSSPAKGARDAVRASLLMQAELERLNRHAGRLGALSMGIGVHLGPVVLGLIGSPQHRSYTALGGTVNLASRMEGMTKQLGATVLISGDVAQHLERAEFVLRPLGTYAPKGAVAPLACFDVMGETRDADFDGPLREEMEASALAAQLLEGRDVEGAHQALERARRLAAGTSRETGYSLRLSALHKSSDSTVRLSEK